MEKSKLVKKALIDKSGIYIPSSNEEEQEIWSRLANISSDINLSYAEDKVYAVYISKISGYDFLDDIYEELIFLEYIFEQCELLKSTSFKFEYRINDKSSETADYLEYTSDKYLEISINRIPYVSGGMLNINVKVEPLKKIYSRLSFASGGSRMETTITNNIDANGSNVVVGEKINIDNSFNGNQVQSIPKILSDEIYSVKEKLIEIDVLEEEIDDLIKDTTKEKIVKFTNKLLPHLSDCASFVTIVSGLAQLM